MKRPSQHVIETQSRRIFESTVPAEWVCRELSHDYGVDYLVEVFSENKSTGKAFFVQLKGSDQEVENRTFKKQFSVKSLEYYNSLTLPVIIICVSTTSSQIWGVWANKLIQAKSLKPSQESVRIKLDERYILDAGSFPQIADQIELSTSIGLHTKTDSETSDLYNRHVCQWLERFYPKAISIEQDNLPSHIQLEYRIIDNCAEVSFATSRHTRRIRIPGLTADVALLHRPILDVEDINSFNQEILLALAVSLAEYDICGTLSLLGKIIPKANFTSIDDWIQMDPVGLLSLALKANQVAEYDKMVKEIIKAGYIEIFLLFDVAYVIFNTPELGDYRTENLKKAIIKSSNSVIKGTCHYNLGNVLRRNGGNAVSHYLAAARLFPAYKNRDYWWRELAGLLFVRKHYGWAEKCYIKSRDIGEAPNESKYFRVELRSSEDEILVHSLIGDCLFMQGKFTEAQTQFQEYLRRSKTPYQEWVLKNMVCLELMDSKLNGVKVDRKKSMELVDLSLAEKSNDQRIKLLDQAIELNPLNNLAWFNLGVAQDSEKKFDQALFSFLLAGLIMDGDKEAQFNALTICLSLKDQVMTAHLVDYIAEKHGALVYNDFSDYVMKRKGSLENKKFLIDTFKSMIDLSRELKDRPLRIEVRG